MISYHAAELVENTFWNKNKDSYKKKEGSERESK